MDTICMVIAYIIFDDLCKSKSYLRLLWFITLLRVLFDSIKICSNEIISADDAVVNRLIFDTIFSSVN